MMTPNEQPIIFNISRLTSPAMDGLRRLPRSQRISTCRFHQSQLIGTTSIPTLLDLSPL